MSTETVRDADGNILLESDWDTASDASAISFTQTGTGAAASTLDAINRSRPLNAVTDFGAVADGTTDTTAALQAAITASLAQKRKLYIPGSSSYYRITSALTTGTSSGFFIYGDGGQGAGGTNAATRIVQATNSEHGLTIGTGNGELPQGGVIQDIGFSGPGATSAGNGIYVNSDSADHLTFNRVICYGFNNGFRAINISNSLWERCTFMNNNLDGFYVTGTYGNSNVINACGAGNNGQSGLRLAVGFGWSINLQDMALVGQIYDLWLEGASTTAAVSGGNFEKNLNGGFCVRAETVSSLSLHGVCFRNFSGGTTGFAISVGAAGLHLDGCLFDGFNDNRKIKMWTADSTRVTATPSYQQHAMVTYFSGATPSGGLYSGGSESHTWNVTELPSYPSDPWGGVATANTVGIAYHVIPASSAAQLRVHKKTGASTFVNIDALQYDADGRDKKRGGSCAFSAYMGASQAPGAGTEATLAFNTEFSDPDSCYNNATYTFTAPVTGIYTFRVTVTVTATGVNDNYIALGLNGTTNKFYIYYESTANTTFHQWAGTRSMLLTAGDTIVPRGRNASAAGFYGEASGIYSEFGGGLVRAT